MLYKLGSTGGRFDTNRTYNEESIWYMMEKFRVAAFGDVKRFVERISVGDIVFFSHRWSGIVAAAKVRGPVRPDGPEALYRDVEFITPVPRRGTEARAMPFGRVLEVTGRSFYWARTIKVPYLSREEAARLVNELRRRLGGRLTADAGNGLRFERIAEGDREPAVALTWLFAIVR